MRLLPVGAVGDEVQTELDVWVELEGLGQWEKPEVSRRSVKRYIERMSV